VVNVEGEQALSISTIGCWIAIFKTGEEEIKDKARFGRQKKLPRSRILLTITRTFLLNF